MKNWHKASLGVAVVGALAYAVPMDKILEGLHLRPYYDPVPVLTYCYGDTDRKDLKSQYTVQECDGLLEARLKKEIDFVQASTKTKLTSQQLAAFASFVYNVGEGNFLKSTLLKKLNAGDIVGACNELPRWTYAGGKQLPGLVSRRATEKSLCLEK